MVASQAIEPLDRRMQQLGVGWEGDVLGLRPSGVLKPLQVRMMPLAEPPPSDSRGGSALKLSKVHWVRPQMVVEVTYLTWTEDNLLLG